jgi:hypothetical protein
LVISENHVDGKNEELRISWFYYQLSKGDFFMVLLSTLRGSFDDLRGSFYQLSKGALMNSEGVFINSQREL